MKRIVFFTLAAVCAIALCACSQTAEIANRWDCTVLCAEGSSENDYIISYANEKIVSSKGVLTIENRNGFDIAVHLFAGGGERVEKIAANGVTVLYQIDKDTEYTLGCHAEVEKDTEIKITVFDGEGNHPS